MAIIKPNDVHVKRDRFVYDEETVEFCKKEAGIISAYGNGSPELMEKLEYDHKLLFMFTKLFEDYVELMKVKRTDRDMFMNGNVHYREATIALMDDLSEYCYTRYGSHICDNVYDTIYDAAQFVLKLT